MGILPQGSILLSASLTDSELLLSQTLILGAVAKYLGLHRAHRMAQDMGSKASMGLSIAPAS
jgi:hypothetical protein